MHILDGYTRLLFPEFIFKLAKAWNLIRDAATADNGIKQLLEVARLLELNIKKNTFLGESNYLSCIYRLLAIALRHMGRVQEAVEYEQKASLEYMQDLLDKAFS
jgi:hypothetical protein